MINANELRIGNWVYKTEFGSDKEEKRLYIIKYPHMDFTFTEAYFPIPLTPEILVKAGFIKTVSGKKILLIAGSFEFEYLDGVNMVIEGQWLPIPHIKYLHQLQNCVQSLTGEELDIKM